MDKGYSTSESSSLVAFYSATGSTTTVAETIVQTLATDIFEIIPKDPYTEEDLNRNNDNSRVSLKHNDNSKQEIPLANVTPDNWGEYDTVYIGYPIWWGLMLGL